jgi:molecular chaperone GrpE
MTEHNNDDLRPHASPGDAAPSGSEKATTATETGEGIIETKAEHTPESREDAAQLKDQLLRKIAEFENYKRRTREEKELLIKYGAEGILHDLLPVIDDFERSLSVGREHKDFAALHEGLELIYGKLLRVLENRGLSQIEAVGKPFDVDVHDALLQVPSGEVPVGTVLHVAEKGYKLHDKVIRHAKVTVSREPDDESTKGEE